MHSMYASLLLLLLSTRSREIVSKRIPLFICIGKSLRNINAFGDKIDLFFLERKGLSLENFILGRRMQTVSCSLPNTGELSSCIMLYLSSRSIELSSLHIVPLSFRLFQFEKVRSPSIASRLSDKVGIFFDLLDPLQTPISSSSFEGMSFKLSDSMGDFFL